MAEHPLYDTPYGKITQFERKLAEAGLDTNMVDAINRKRGLAKAWVGDLRLRLSPAAAEELVLHFGRFSPVDMLVADFRQHNRELDLGFSSERIDALLGSIPVFVWDDPLKTLFIRWTLGDLKSSADAKLDVMRHVFGQNKLYVSDNFQTENLYLPDGTPPFQLDVLEWGIIDLGNVRNTAPDKVDPAIAAGLKVFDASAQHPAHTRAHNGRDIPYLDVPGLRVKVPGGSGPYAPYVDGRSGGGVGVYVYWAGRAVPYYAGPVLVRES